MTNDVPHYQEVICKPLLADDCQLEIQALLQLGSHRPIAPARSVQRECSELCQCRADVRHSRWHDAPADWDAISASLRDGVRRADGIAAIGKVPGEFGRRTEPGTRGPHFVRR